MRLREILSAVPACVCAMQVASALPAMAQPAGLLKPEGQAALERHADGTQTRLVRVRNWAAPDVAFLLDPEHQPEPLMFSLSRQNSAALSGDNAKVVAEVFPRPSLAVGASIKEVANLQNTLVLRGTPEALDAWTKAIAEIDKPLVQVETEIQMVRLTPEALKALGTPTDAPGPHLLAENATVKMRELLEGKQAKIVTAPRILTISGLTADLNSATSVPARIVPLPDGDGGAKSDLAALLPPGRLWIRKSIGVAVRSIVRPDDAIDMKISAGISWNINSELGNAPVSRPQEVSYLAQDGRSYLFYASPNFESVPPKRDATNSLVPQPAQIAQPDAEGQISVFIVQASIVRRAPVEN